MAKDRSVYANPIEFPPLSSSFGSLIYSRGHEVKRRSLCSVAHFRSGKMRIDRKTRCLSTRLPGFRFTCQPEYRCVLTPPLNVTRICVSTPPPTWTCRATLSNIVKLKVSQLRDIPRTVLLNGLFEINETRRKRVKGRNFKRSESFAGKIVWKSKSAIKQRETLRKIIEPIDQIGMHR